MYTLTYIIYLTKDVIYILPTGYGKSLIFHLTPLLMFARDHIKQVDFLSPWKSLGISTQGVSCIVIVISPLHSLTQDQISRLKSSGLRASAIL
jgi:superfamily II DNA helicase RecQ